MNKIIFSLELQMQGPEVADLQAALQLLLERGAILRDDEDVRNELSEALQSEHAEQFYGDITRRLVHVFQEHSGLESSGSVDEPTADAINALLDQWGVLEPEEEAPRYEVRGMVRDTQGEGMPGLAVRAYELLLQERRLLGEAETFRNGFYEIGYRPPRVRGRIKRDFALVVVVTKSDGEEWTSEPVFGTREVEWVEFFAGEGEYPGESEYEQTVEKVLPLVGDTPLAELVETDDRKNISYVSGRTGLDTQEIMMLVVAHHLANRTGLGPEVFYGLFKQRLPQNLPGSLLNMTFGFTMLEQLVDRLLTGVLAINPDVLHKALQRAVDANQVPLALGERIDGIVASLHQQRRDQILDRPNLIGKSDLRSLLDMSSLKEEHYPLFARLYDENSGTTNRFWQALEENGGGVGEDEIRDLRLTLDLGLKIKNHPPLLRTLKSSFVNGEFGHPRELAKWTAGRWEDTIRAAATDTDKGYPPNIDGDDEDEKIATYAHILAERFERAYPTMALVGRFDRDQSLAFAHKADVLKFFDNNPEVNLKTLHVDRYVAENRDQALAGIEEPYETVKEVRVLQRALQLAPSAGAADALLQADLSSAQKIYAHGKSRFVREAAEVEVSKPDAEKIYANAELKYAMIMARLLEYNLDFNRVLPNAILPTVTPELIEDNNVTEGVPNVRGLFGSLDYCACEHCQSVYGPAAYLVDLIAYLKERRAKLSGPVKDVLFKRRPDIGEVDLNCANTNTPLPYIDLVSEVLEDAISPLPVYTLPASVAPHLVAGSIEIELRDALSAGGLNVSEEAEVSVVRPDLTWAIRDRGGYYKVHTDGTQFLVRLSRQTLGAATELQAHPEYVNRKAYEKLRDDARFPMSLPFDLWWEEARAYLAHLGIDRHRLMEAFQETKSSPPLPSTEHIAAERFGISEGEARIVWTQDTTNQAKYWGVSNPVGDLTKVSVFLKQAGFLRDRGEEYRRLLELLAARFVNPEAGASTILRGEEPCNTDQQSITNLDPDKLDRMHRFIRLWRRTGWKMWELDRLIRSAAIGNGNLNEVCLKRLRRFDELQEKLELSTEQLLAFYKPLNVEAREIMDEREDPLYAQLFLNKTVTNPVNAAFEVEKVTDANTSVLLADHTATILSALTITEQDFMRLAAGTDGKLTLENLSVLHRYAVLARALKLRIEELLLLLNLTGTADPFAVPERTGRLVDHVEAIREADFTIRDLEYLLTYSPDSPLGLSAALTTQYLEQVRGNLRKVGDDVYNGAATPAESARKNLAGFKAFGQPEDLEAAIELIEGRWSGSPADRDAFIETKFVFFADTAEAKTKLGTLTGTTPSDREAKIAQRYAYVLSNLYRYAADRTVIETLSNLLKLEPQQVRICMENIRRNGKSLIVYFRDENLVERGPSGDFLKPLTDPAFAVLFESMHLLHKVALLIAQLKVKAEHLKWLILNPTNYGGEVDGTFAGGLEFSKIPVKAGEAAIPFHSWLFTARLLEFNARYPEREGVSFLTVLEDLSDLNSTLVDLGYWTRWEQTEISAINGILKLQHPDDYRYVETYRRMAECLRLARQAGVGVGTLAGWTQAALTGERSDQIKLAVKAKYTTEEWPKVSAALQDGIRDKKRAALVDHLIANPKDKVAGDPAQGKVWDDADGLFAYYLVDVEMSACQATSRIKQAAGSVQLFVQRCFLNLEPEVVVDVRAADGDDSFYDEDWLQWKWMKNYRVWEANRKVFLYPENWIEPELRDDKSPFFRELENELQQNEVTDDYVEDVFLNYLEKLDDVARLEVCGVYQHSAPERNVLHVISRTRATPHIYYHRERINNAQWTAWRKVDVDIQGDHVLPVVYNRKLHLLWLTFTEKPEQGQPVPAPEGGSSPPPEPKKYLEIQLAWSTYKNGKWSPKKVSPSKLIHPWPRPAHSYSMQCSEDGLGTLYINLYVGTSKEFNNAPRLDKNGNPSGYYKYPYLERHSETAKPWHSSTFVFDGEVTQVRVANVGGWYDVVHNNYGEDGRAIASMTWQAAPRRLPNGMHYANNLLTNNVDTLNDDLNVVVLDSRLRNGELVLKDIATPFRVATPSDSNFFDPNRLFFFQDGTRAYFVTPETQYRLKYDASGQVWVPDSNTYTFHDFYHPYTTLFIRELNRFGLDGLLNRRIQVAPESLHPINAFSFDGVYHPNKPFVRRYNPDQKPGDPDNPKEIVDFSSGAAYGPYNWELFFHAPLLIACRLGQNQRFEEALRWFHYIFDPTNPSKEETPKKYWITKPFYNHNREDYRNQKIENLLKNVNARVTSYVQQVEEWRDNPFKPHLIARLRNVAYQWTVVMKYLDNLISWGDQLFRRDTIESINEATQLYVLAAEILGQRPVQVPEVEREAHKSFNDIEASLDDFGNVLQEYENQIAVTANGSAAPATTEKLPRFNTFLFGIPPNEKLLGYWDTVADRLFKIRHCMNIEGVVRQLPLFEPAIDPAALVKAAAAGVDIGSVLSDANVLLPHYRFTAMVQKANEFCNDVKALGNALLAALEKRDAEALALLRSSHETAVLEAVKLVREQQISEAWETKNSLEKTKIVVEERRNFYQHVKKHNDAEIISMGLHGGAIVSEIIATVLNATAGTAHLIPRFKVGASGFGGTPTVTVEFGGDNVGKAAFNWAAFFGGLGGVLHSGGNLSSAVAGYERRWDEWKLQERLANKELEQVQKQIDAAMLRWEIAKKELNSVERQTENAVAVDDFMRSKYTDQELYDWMVGQVSSVYFQAYQLAYDMAKRAEKAYRHEIGQYDATFVNFGYWDSLKRGLLAGEKLGLDLRRLEAAYLDQNKREYELTKHVSLAEVAPGALMKLKANGSCDITLPELLFDMDRPGDFMRRIKSVGISIPCVVGPYTGVNCTLTLLKNSVRVNSRVGSEYERDLNGSDERFRDNLAAVQSIATSHAREDSGTFELNFRDERYLPFEGAGAISEWRIDLPEDSNYFDFATISDVVIHLRYTAREGGGLLREAAAGTVQAALPTSGVQLFDLKREFPTPWHRFIHPGTDGADQELILNPTNEHFPFYVRNRTIKVKSLAVFADIVPKKVDNPPVYEAVLSPPLAASDVLVMKQDGQYGPLHHVRHQAPQNNPYPLGEWKFKMKKQTAADFKSLQPDEVQGLAMIVEFELSG